MVLVSNCGELAPSAHHAYFKTELSFSWFICAYFSSPFFLLLTTVRPYKDIKILALLSATCRTSELDGPRLIIGKQKNGELDSFLQKKNEWIKN